MKMHSVAVTRVEVENDTAKGRFISRGKDVFKDSLNKNYTLRLELGRIESITEASKSKSNKSDSKVYSPQLINGGKSLIICSF